MTSVTISLLEAGREEWDAYVAASPEATFFHRAGWKRVIEEAFGHKTYYLAARSRGEVTGVLPLTRIKSRLFGSRLISNAFCVHGGPLANDHETRCMLADEAVRLAHSLQVSSLELRGCGDFGRGWVLSSGLYANFRRPLAPTIETNLKLIPRKQRAMVRKGIANGLVSEVDDDSDRLYEVYAASVHRLGTPVFSKRYFELLKREFEGDCDIVTVLAGNEPVASVMNFYFRDEVLPYYGGGTEAARTLAANDFLYWEVMRRACERGIKSFDFGRSKVGTGSYAFKHNWGFSPVPLSYAYCSFDGRDSGEVNPLNPKYASAIRLWQRLPFALTKIIGPYIVRSLG